METSETPLDPPLISHLTIVQQSRSLEEAYKTDITGESLLSDFSWRELKKKVLSSDKELTQNLCHNRH